jgi:serine/threonine protein phosphatase PrpC
LLQVSIEAFQGRRETMEDEVVVSGGGRFVGVFDGHGGGDVSGYLKKHLYHLFLLHLEQNHWLESDSDVEDIKLTTPSISAYMTAIRQALHSVETEVIRHSELSFVGSTAVAVILHENPGGYRTMISANVGDSRAILCRNGKAMDLTKDHKPTDDAERKRILRAGGRIFLDDTGCHRVMNLSLSRAIGDGFSKPIVSPEPDIRRFRVEDDGDEFILLASDGLWDVMSSQDAVDFVKARLREAKATSEHLGKEEQGQKISEARQTMAKVIVQEAMKLGTADNTSVVMVWLKDPMP